MTGQLNEVERREMEKDISCLDIAPIAHGQRARFMVSIEIVSSC